MKVVILAGGYGSRLSEETQARPKPMVEIGGQPILWHLMMIYSAYGFDEFIVCLGYKGYVIKEYFANFVMHRSDLVVDLAKRSIQYSDTARVPPWKVHLVDTGVDTLTGGRLKRIGHLLKRDETFCMTYGDGLAAIDIKKLVAFHKKKGCAATLTAVRPPGRYGATVLKGDRVKQFTEKPEGDGGYINGGFFVLNESVLDRIEGDATAWESGPLESLAADGELGAFRHDGFWHAMDTLRDKNHLEKLWVTGHAPWKVWR